MVYFDQILHTYAYQHSLTNGLQNHIFNGRGFGEHNIFVAVFLGCTSTGRVGLCFLWFYVQELPKAQPAVVLVLKRLRRRGNGFKSHPTDCEKPGIEPATPGLQDIGLSPTPRRLLKVFSRFGEHKSSLMWSDSVNRHNS